MADLKIYLADARRELTYVRIELINKKIKNIGYRAPSFIIITLPRQTTFINFIKANYSAKLPDTPKYISERNNLKPWIIQLKIKLKKNMDYYLIIKSKLFYIVFRFKGRAIILI